MMIASIGLTAASAFVAQSACVEMRLARAALSRPACGPAPARSPDAAEAALPTFEPALELEARLPRHFVAPGVFRLDATDFVIQRDAVDRLFEQHGLLRQAELRPQTENGRVVGVRVFGFRRESVLAALGMENGDLVRSVNGLAVTSPESALEAYARLRQAELVEVHVRRGRRDVVLRYAVE